MAGYARISAADAAEQVEVDKPVVIEVVKVVGFDTDGVQSGSFLGRRRVLLAVLAVLVLATCALLLGLGCSDRACSKYSYAQVQAALSKALQIKDKQVQEQAEEIEELEEEMTEEAEEVEEEAKKAAEAKEEAEEAKAEAKAAKAEAVEAEAEAEEADEEAKAAEEKLAEAEAAGEKLAEAKLLPSNIRGSKPAAPGTPVQG